MKILITGAKGQLGQELKEVLFKAGNYEVIGLGHSELEITNPAMVKELIEQFTPEVIIHTAANTNVDGCELEPESGYRINALGTRNVAIAASMVKAKLVFISTDYVFDGYACRPYLEFDSPNPINIYGKSKLAGEKYVASFSNKYFIVRTSWLYGKQGNNFVKTMLNLAKQKDELTVVDDQLGTPTFTKDLAQFIAVLIETELYGIYHASNTGACSWFDFAKLIFKLAGLNQIKIKPVSTAELNRPASRPAYSVLDNYCLRLEGLPGLRPWEDALQEFITRALK